MSNRVLGILCCVVSIVLWFYAIPEWVSSPSNVTKVVLSPTFWPLIIAGLIALCGAYLLVTGEVKGDEQIEVLERPQNKGAGATRLIDRASDASFFGRCRDIRPDYRVNGPFHNRGGGHHTEDLNSDGTDRYNSAYCALRLLRPRRLRCDPSR